MIKLNAITEYDQETELMTFEYMCLRQQNHPDNLDKRLANYREDPAYFDDDVLFDNDCRSASWSLDNGLILNNNSLYIPSGHSADFIIVEECAEISPEIFKDVEKIKR